MSNFIGTWHLQKHNGNSLPDENLQSMSLQVTKLLDLSSCSGYLLKVELKPGQVSKINLPVYFKVCEKILLLSTLHHKKVDELMILSSSNSRLTLKSLANKQVLSFEKAVL